MARVLSTYFFPHFIFVFKLQPFIFIFSRISLCYHSQKYMYISVREVNINVVSVPSAFFFVELGSAVLLKPNDCESVIPAVTIEFIFTSI